MMRRLGLCLVVIVAACGRDKIEVSKTPGDDYKHSALVTAVDKFVGAGRTPDAYAELAQTVSSLRPQMDRTVGKEAELKMIVLALGPIQAQQAKSNRERIDALALTVWPTLLAPPIASDTLLAVRDADVVIRTLEDPVSFTGWRSGQLQFDDTPLAEAVAEFNRYNRRPIRLADARAGAMHVSGAFRTSGEPAFVGALAAGFPVRVRRDARDGIVIAAR